MIFSCHHVHWLFLCHCWTPLTSIDNPRNGSFCFYWVHPATMSIGYPFVILELLWHQWQLYSQQSPPLALMATSKHSPPLTTMTKDNLLCHCCTHFDIGFLVFLLCDNSHCHHISPLLTGLGTNQCIVIYLNIPFLATGSWMIDPWTPPVTVLLLLCQHFCDRVYTQHFSTLFHVLL